MSKPDKWGRVVESAIGAHLLNYAIREDFSIFYWRERNEEVDFVLEKQGKVIPIEVKTNYAKKKNGMNAFNRKFHPHKMILVDNPGMNF